jgi:O-antigen/teichoic acid export membrane protein
VLGLTVVDQGASSVSNFALAIVVAHYSQARQVGVFALLTVTYILAQGFVRSMTSDCMLSRHETDDGIMARYESGGYLSAIALATCLSVVILAVSAGLPRTFAIPFATFALFFPFMAMQDFSRFIGISRHDPAYAVWLDTAWLVLFVVFFVLLKHAHMATLPWLWAAWCGAGALIGLFTMTQFLRLRGARGRLRFWISSEKSVGLRFAGQFMLSSTWIYFVFYLLVFVISIEAVGQIKVAQLALGPLTVLASGVQVAIISIVAKRFRQNVTKALWFCFFVALAVAVMTGLWTLAIYVIPTHTVAQAIGPTWPQARILFVVTGIGFMLGSFSGIATSGLRAIRAATANLWLAVAMVPVSFIACIGGAAWDGALGFCIGLAIAFGIYAVLGWGVLFRESRHYLQDDEEAEAAQAAETAAPALA